MKSITSLNLDVSVVEALKARAKAEGRSVSAIANEGLAGYLAVSKPRPLGPLLSTRAQLAVEAVTALTQAAAKLPPTDPQWLFREFRMDQICRKVGDYPSRLLPVLRECERAGVLKLSNVPALGMDEDAPKLDHWRLPSE